MDFICGIGRAGQDAARRVARCGSAAVSRRVTTLAFAAGAAVAGVCAAQAEPVEGPAVRLELNRLEPQGETCRVYLLIRNASEEAYRSYKLDLFAFDKGGVAAKRLAVETGPLPAGKTLVKLFDFADLPCARFGQVLLNDILTCETSNGPRAGCAAAAVAASRVSGVEFVK